MDTFGISKDPICVYSIQDQAQGLAYRDGNLYISSSYGVANSSIRAYNIESAHEGSISILGYEDLPLYELDSAVLKADYVLPPMSEEIEFVDNRFYTMCESASNKYIFVLLFEL